jgi:hypothetical protein
MDGWIDFTNTWCFFTEAAPAPFDGAREASGVTGGVQRRWVNRGKPTIEAEKRTVKTGENVGYQDRKWGLDM